MSLFSRFHSDATHGLLTVVGSPHVTSDSGTGLVHMAPAHGFEDYSAFKSMGGFSPSQSEIVCHVDREGNFSSKVQDVVGEECAKELVGKAVLDEGSRQVVQLLRQAGVLLKIKRIKHKYPYDWRTKEPVIVTYLILFLHVWL
jgi:isoleucyl-tRNA synthetase